MATQPRDTRTTIASIIFTANVLIAGVVGALTLFGGDAGARLVFQSTTASSASLKIVGAMWLTIMALSIVGMFRPRQMMLVFVLQLLYKGTWLLAVALPAVMQGKSTELPAGVAWFFLIWVLVLPWVIEWKTWFWTAADQAQAG